MLYEPKMCTHCGKLMDGPTEYKVYMQSTNDARIYGQKMSVEISSSLKCYCNDCYQKRIRIKKLYLWITIALMLVILATLIILNVLCNRFDVESISIILMFILVGLPFINSRIYRLHIDHFNNV